MGDPRKIRSKYQGPRHPWNKERIDEERILMRTYGLSNKKELWKVGSQLKNFKDTAKRLIAQWGDQAEKERAQLFSRLQSLGLVGADATTDEVLGLKVEQLLDRRLQTLVFKKELARSAKQARQFITHGHIIIGNDKVTAPGYIVPVAQEGQIEFKVTSSLSKADHPERVPAQKATGASSKEVKVKGSDHQVETSAGQEEAPVTKTAETAEEDKPIEQQIEDDTANAKEVEEAVDQVESDKKAEDHKKEVAEKAAEKKKEEEAQ